MPCRVSALLNDAAQQELQQTRVQEYLRELYEQHGAPDAAARREAQKRIKSVLDS